MKQLSLLFCSICLTLILKSQNVGIGTTVPDASARLEVADTSKGLLLPRLTTTQRNAIVSPANGLLVFVTSDSSFYYYYTSWIKLPAASQTWSLTGNANTSAANNFIGTTDNIPFTIKVNNQQAALLDSSKQNAFFGYQSGNAAASPHNTAIGFQALNKVAAGQYNVAAGTQALFNNTDGYDNTAIGNRSLYNNTDGFSNTATGDWALLDNISGYNNTAFGKNALIRNTNGIENSGLGVAALGFNRTGNSNTALGFLSLYNDTTGSNNTAAGKESLYNTLNGNNNTAFGSFAGRTNATGSNNTFIGSNADVTAAGLSNAGAIGYNAKVGASNSFVIGGTNSDAVNVGIGTTTPVAKLHVVGDIKLNDFFIKNKTGTNSFVIGNRGDTTKDGNFYAGYDAGYGVTGANAGYNVIVGYQAGYNATNVRGSYFFGYQAGVNAVNADGSFFAGISAGSDATNSRNSLAIGTGAMNSSPNAEHSIAIGHDALLGQDSSAYTIAIGINAGYGLDPGYNRTMQLGNNNILIGKHITLPNHTSNGLNIGNVIYGMNLQDKGNDDLYLDPQTNGKIGINVLPVSSLHVAGSIRNTDSLLLTGIASNAGTKALRYNPATGNVTYSDTTNAGNTYTGGLGIGLSGTVISVDTASASILSRQRAENSYLKSSGGILSGNLLLSSNTIIGGSTTTSDLFLQSTSGTGSTGADIHFLVGNNGATEALTILNNGNVGIGTSSPSEKLDVTGNIKATGTITPSDERFKKNIEPLKNNLQKLLMLNGVSYYWKQNEFSNRGFTNQQQIGFIAQDVEKVFPQVVHTGNDGYKGLDYAKLIPVLAEAIKEQQKEIEALKKMIRKMK